MTDTRFIAAGFFGAAFLVLAFVGILAMRGKITGTDGLIALLTTMVVVAAFTVTVWGAAPDPRNGLALIGAALGFVSGRWGFPRRDSL